MNNTEQELSSDSQNPGYSRRSVLKLLSASGAAVGLDKLLPTTWITPHVFAQEDPLPDAVDIPPIQIRNLNFHWNNSIVDLGQTWCNGSAMFEYRSTVVNISEQTHLFALLNSSGVFSNGDTIAKVGGQVIPADQSLVTGNISIPLPGYFPRNQWDALAVMLREPMIPTPYDSNSLIKDFFPCNGPLIADLEARVCGPKVNEGTLYCTYIVRFKYIDGENAVTKTSSLYVAHGSTVLLSDATLGRIGINPDNPHQGIIEFKVDIPEGNEGHLHVYLANDNENPSNILHTARPFVSECPQELPLVVHDSNSQLLPNSSFVYNVSFLFNDSAGLLSNQSLLTARLVNGPLIYNALPLAQANGSVAIKGFYSTPVNGSKHCPGGVVINSTFGTGQFQVKLPEVSRLAIQADSNLGWFLGDPNDSRTSNTEITILADPLAISLAEISAEPQKTGLAAAVAAAAALGTATLVAKMGADEQAEDEPLADS